MRGHGRFLPLIAGLGDARPTELDTVRRHLAVCDQCRAREVAYTEQRAMLRTARRELPPAYVREAVLTRAEVLARAPGRRARHSPLGLAVRLAAAAILLVGVSVNTPLPRAVGQRLGVVSAPPTTVLGVPCNQDGLAILGEHRILKSPEQFDPGPHGVYYALAAREAAAKLVHPIWYVNHGGSDTGGCSAGMQMDAEVGYNPDNGTQLHVFGRLEDGAGPDLP